ncbi:MAG: pilus assembly protein PilP [Syntrophales bacterium]|nr:pilus assembly protein PilP [Syntrophales bacterium]
MTKEQAKGPPQPPAPTASPSEVKAKLAQGQTFSYDPRGKPDPFKPFLEYDATLRKKLEEQRRRQFTSPLQQYPVEQYQLVGIGRSKERKVALVKDVAGKFYELHIGSKIGQQNGRVADIGDNRVTVEETAGLRKGKKAKPIRKYLILRSDIIKEGKL